jgi:hypothetical protein
MFRNPRQSSRFATQRRASTRQLDASVKQFQTVLLKFIEKEQANLIKKFYAYSENVLPWNAVRDAYKAEYGVELSDEDLQNTVQDLPFYMSEGMERFFRDEIAPQLLDIKDGKSSYHPY